VKDLDAEGLGEYRDYLQKRFQNSSSVASFGNYSSAAAAAPCPPEPCPPEPCPPPPCPPSPCPDSLPSQQYHEPSTSRVTGSTTLTTVTSTTTPSSNNNNRTIIELIFRSIDRLNLGRISVEDAEKILLRLNSRLGRRYGEDDVSALFDSLDENHDNTISFEEFKKAFNNLNLSA
jgi:hypothetical protein